MSIVVEIIEDAAPALKRLQLALQNGEANQEIGRAVAERVKEHFYGKPPNERRFPTTQFWQRAAAATDFTADSDGARVSINQIGVRQRFLGGPIAPVRGKFLTVPAIAETYGHSADDFANLKIRAVAPGGWSGLGLAPSDAARNQDGRVSPGSVYFWLFTHVTQRPDPDVLPDKDEITDTALDAARDYFARLKSRNRNN